MNPVLEDILGGADQYDDLPESIKTVVTPKEFDWLSDGEKARLIQNETEPEYEE